MIQVQNLSVGYHKKQVLFDINLEISQGGVTSIIGPNGAGKSTLLGAIGRILPVDSGAIKINHLDTTSIKTRELAKILSFLRQDNSINARLTVQELIGFGRYPYSQGKLTEEDQKIIDETLNTFGLADLQNNYINELSGGQRQRAYIAMIFCQNTDYILLDEPLNNMDIKHSVDIMQLIKKIAKDQNKTIVIVIHDINFASKYSDNIIAMKSGQIVSQENVVNTMKKEVLENIFETPIEIIEHNGEKVALYY